MNNMFIATDHRGVALKNKILNLFPDIVDLSPVNESFDDYPDFAFKMCKKVLETNGKGILVCGSGNGMCIAANKVKGIRAIIANTPELSINCTKEYNCNVIVLSEDVEESKLVEIINGFYNGKEPFEERHIRRINKIIKYENGEYNEL